MLPDRPDGADPRPDASGLLVHALSSLPTGILIVERPGGRPILANKRFLEIHGADATVDPRSADFTSCGTWTREDGSPYPVDQLPLSRTLADGQAHSVSDLWLERPDGVRFALAVESSPIDYEGRTAAVLVVTDVSDLRTTERLRRAAETLYRDLFEQATDGIFVITRDDSLTIVAVNPAGERVFDFERGQLDGLGASVLAPEEQPDGRSTHALLVEQLRDMGEEGVVRLPLRGRKKGGAPIELELTMQPLRLEDSPDLLLTQVRDVTRERALEDSLRQAKKLEAVGVLAGGLAHDYNNLLTGVLGFNELALEKLPASGDPALETVRKCLGETKRCAERSADLTRQLLTLSRTAPPASDVVDLNAAIERALGTAKRLAGASMIVRTDLAPGECPVRGDAAQLEQAIVNLVVNARAVLPPAGCLHVRTWRHGATGPARPPLDLAEGEYVFLEVSDDDLGTTATTGARGFEPSFATDGAGQGMGIGRAVINTVVARHGGRLFVETPPAGGCRFTVVLRCLAAHGAEEEPGRQDELPRGEGSILVVDDDASVQEVTVAMLEAVGYSVSKAASAAQALGAVAQRHFDLVISDVVMAGGSGIELARRLGVEDPSLKILLASGYAQDVLEREGTPPRVSGFLEKPLSMAVLARKVRDVLTGARAPGATCPRAGSP